MEMLESLVLLGQYNYSVGGNEYHSFLIENKERITQMKVKVKETKSGRGIGRRGGNRSGSVRRRPTTITAWGEDKHRSATNQNQKISPEKLRKEITQFLHSMTNQ